MTDKKRYKICIVEFKALLRISTATHTANADVRHWTPCAPDGSTATPIWPVNAADAADHHARAAAATQQDEAQPTPIRWEDTAEFFSALERFVNDTSPRTVQDLVSEFTELNAAPAPVPSPMFTRNVECNRYRDVICTEINRVRLHTERYIHANWITTFGENRFIYTQGPLETTCDDSWTMIAQENIESIVMLCDIIEQNRIKCHQYWPTVDNRRMRFANNQITANSDANTTWRARSTGRTSSSKRHGCDRAPCASNTSTGDNGPTAECPTATWPRFACYARPISLHLLRDTAAQNKASKLNINVNALNTLVQALNSTMQRG
ncbi:hypothetical protein niasHS_014055 [Heterodera schachtii]|uniref:Tyrosine-protein phosphatase domain-containing protein n=1 Tax=Heterodera schachtii TaxID=97005 RepID=A0ABD2J2D8_HETSC